MPDEPTVFIVDDDETLCRLVGRICRAEGLQAVCFTSAAEFLEQFDPNQPGCLLLDIRMPGMSGPELQEELIDRQAAIPIIFISGHADVPLAVQCMKKGAFELIEKPFRNEKLLFSIHKALLHDARGRQEQAEIELLNQKLAGLTRREGQILTRLAEGKLTKNIAQELGISVKTVDFHRKKLMEKLDVDTLVDLGRMIAQLHNKPHE